MVKNPEGKYNPEAVGNFNSDELGTMSLEDLVRLGIIPEINVPSVSKSRSVVSSNFNTSSNVHSSVNESDTAQSSSLTNSASFSKEKSSTPTYEQKRIESSYHNIHNVTSDSLPQKLSVHKSHSNSQFAQQNSTSSQANDSNIKRTSDADETSTRGARIEDALKTERNSSIFSDGNNFERQSSVDSISSNRSKGIQDSSNVSHLPHNSTTNFETSQNSSHENPTSKSHTENSNVFLALKTSENPSFYLTPSSLLLEPSIVSDLPRANSARSSQDSLDETRTIGELKRAFYLY